MIDLNWEKFWRDQNRILEIFFDFLIVEKGLSQNTVFSYKRDFKLLSLYLYNSAWFKKNVSPQKRQKDFYHSIDNRFNKNKLASLRHLNHKILREFFYLLKEKGFKNTSRARIHSTLKQFFDYELKQKNISASPIEFIDKPNVKRSLPTILSEKDIDTLLHFIRKGPLKNDSKAKQKKKIKIKCLIEILYSTGLRVSELINLKIQDIDLKKRTLVVFGKGGKERNAYFTTKTAKSIIDWIDYSSNKEKYLFPSHSVSGHITRDSVNKILTEISNELGFSKNQLTPHKLRHAFATHMLNKGADIRVIQQLLGHANVSTTEIYTHILDSETIETVLKNHPLEKSLG
tara:strand:+ start:2123 stop:3154 length:1032 start_codon:yes stop_codon:yes gene_type:complete